MAIEQRMCSLAALQVEDARCNNVQAMVCLGMGGRLRNVVSSA